MVALAGTKLFPDDGELVIEAARCATKLQRPAASCSVLQRPCGALGALGARLPVGAEYPGRRNGLCQSIDRGQRNAKSRGDSG
jgi:hypothetical protein